MRRRTAIILFSVSAAGLLSLGIVGLLQAAADDSKAPDESEPPKAGIASKYPHDRDIIKDKHVVFADDFERTDFSRWDVAQHPKQTKLARTKANVHAGKQSVEMTAVMPNAHGGDLIKWFKPGFDRLHARFYVKFEKDHSYVHHFVHIVGGRDQWSGFGKAGRRPNGSDFFTTGIEPDSKWGRVKPPGVWHFYTYWPDMKGSPGRYWGNDFSPKTPIPIPLDKWICVEFMVQANSAPDKNDGEQAFWIDGKLAGRFTGIRWRHTNDLKINAFWLLYYVTPQALRRSRAGQGSGTSRVWFDDVVVATKYIGPMKTKRPPSSSPKTSGKFIIP